jgi:hypothetical protein
VGKIGAEWLFLMKKPLDAAIPSAANGGNGDALPAIPDWDADLLAR